jgi:hypothetical protein
MTYMDTILDIMEARLNELGPITMIDAYKLCEDTFHRNTISVEFKKIMRTMIEQGKAIKQGRGWKIEKPNSRIKPIAH